MLEITEKILSLGLDKRCIHLQRILLIYKTQKNPQNLIY